MKHDEMTRIWCDGEIIEVKKRNARKLRILYAALRFIGLLPFYCAWLLVAASCTAMFVSWLVQ